ncbi:MAG: aromatic ring-hydroxylating dioxygenase subunit alpha [Candidatus Tectomicrobia bacterium]|nr:aromatic ring-hydroxylating dioxygenase subunit alpha [Candidatus Tectomicrobia bacterium]
MEHETLANLVIDNKEDGLFRVHRQAFTNPDLLAFEQRRVFENTWIYAGHTSEIPQPGDFRARRVAGRPVILVRGTDGAVRVLLNTCTHRGAQVCREASGNANTFQCFYHAWTFNNQGDLIGVPGDDAYSEAFDRRDLGLGAPPRVEDYRGFVFISFNADIEPLVEYLAGAREYLDLICDQSEVGMEVVTGTQAYSMRANWKLLVENSMDGYHARTTHQRYFDYLVESGVDVSRMKTRRGGRGKALGNGHAVIQSEPVWGRPIARWSPEFGEAKRAELEQMQRDYEARFGAEWAYRITQTSRNLLIFPNLIINDIMAITIRTFFPVSPDYLEINAWALAPSDESPQDRALRLDHFLTFLGPGGYATPDDVEALESCQLGYLNREIEWNDLSRGMKRAEPEITDELQMRAFWRQWHTLMLRTQTAATPLRRPIAV